MTGTETPRIPDADLADVAEQQRELLEPAEAPVSVEPGDPAREADAADVAEQQVEIGYGDEREPG